MKNSPLLTKLVDCGYQIQIKQGRLSVLFATGYPRELSKEEQARLVDEIASLVPVTLLSYQGYRTGLYPVSSTQKCAGLYMTLSIAGQPQKDAYSLFNIEATYTRTTAKHKAGEALPKGQFRAKPRSKFTNLWRACGFSLPDGGKTSAFHSRMGKLLAVIMTGTESREKPGRFHDLTPACISHETIKTAYRAERKQPPAPIQHLSNAQSKPNKSLRAAPKEIAQAQQMRALETDSGTGETSTEKGQQVEANNNPYKAMKEGYRVFRPEQPPANDQSIDDWLADYDSAPWA